MRFAQAFRLAVKSMASSKMRAFLTMLGIIIGVAAVIVLVSLVGGFSNSMSESFESLGTNLITVSIPGRGGNVKVSVDEMFDFAAENNDVIGYISPTVTTNATVKYGTTNMSTTVYGASEDYLNIKNFSVSDGRFISYMDAEGRHKVCVLGSYTASELFAGESPVGNTVKINGDSYTVVGVLSEKQGGTEGSQDDMMVIPYSMAVRLSQNATVSSYLFSAREKDTVDEAMDRIEAYLLSIFNDEDTYRVYNQADSLEQINELSSTLTLVLVGIAAISLLVGGIGIMNIMLVSVTERTREIGIRKSLGGKRRDILLQFVIEAATTSGLGGVIGIVVGCVCAYFGGQLMGLSAAISPEAVGIAFSVSVVIGITFGYFPAAKASKLNPIEALRYD